MNKQDVIDFFDKCAPWWDDDMIRHDDLITTIFTGAGIRPGIDVLDVACGTGVLFPDYLKRNVGSVTAIDISPEMAKLAASKFPEVNVICGDVETTDFGKQFDTVMVYNAFPHFPNPAKLIEVLAGVVKPGGKLSIAHGMSRAALINHHKRAANVSIDLLEANELVKLLEPWFDVDVVISTDRMYQVAGVRKDGNTHSHAGYVHSHDFDHDHDHSHGVDGTPMEELVALMKFMVSHNDAHAQELAELASQLQAAGKAKAYTDVMDTVADFDVVNARLDAIMKALALDL